MSIGKCRLVMVSISSVAISTTICSSFIRSFADLACNLLRYIFTHLLWNLMTFFDRNFKWNLSADRLAYFSWLIMTCGGSWYNFGYWSTMSFRDCDALWYFDMSWYLNWGVFTNTIDFGLAYWFANRNCSWA